MKKYYPIFVAVMFMGCSHSDSAKSAEKSTASEQSESTIVYVINLDGQRIPIKNGDIKRNLKTALEYTPEGDAKSGLTKDQIKQLAKEIGLLQETKTNPHLSFLDGDIAFWQEQKLSLERMRLEFAARKAVLDAAERSKVVIDDQGKLSWASQQIMAQMLKVKKEKNAKVPQKTKDQK